MKNYSVKKISYDQAREWILQIHYAHRMPPVQKVFGLFKDKKIIGVCSYGKPVSFSLCDYFKDFNFFERNY